jgi:hypothetical protein
MRALRRVLLPVAQDWVRAHGQNLADKWVATVSRCCTLAQASQLEQILRMAENRAYDLRRGDSTTDLHCAGELEDFAAALRDAFCDGDGSEGH